MGEFNDYFVKFKRVDYRFRAEHHFAGIKDIRASSPSKAVENAYEHLTIDHKLRANKAVVYCPNGLIMEFDVDTDRNAKPVWNAMEDRPDLQLLRIP